ncbi:MAG: SUMF1/EgtB/PvdO family nonheme iron enzyme [Deltaproteobacteria bacterium]|nr:SUMF1/EgtB/PvdO family nonheme iron enzyme [Deltaproteobacteria bacterium]
MSLIHCLLLWMLLFYPGPALAETWLEPLTGMEFILVPGGSFLRGQSDAEKVILIREMGDKRYGKYCAGERPRRQVTVSDFWLSRSEVSNAAFRHFRPGHDSGVYKELSLNGEQQPVVEVSWEDAQAFTCWLSKVCGRDCRLPTEAEWEYACRAGQDEDIFRGDAANAALCVYANVADLSAKKLWPAWAVATCDDGFPVAAPVGSLAANSLGLYDMLGNVWEWCSDWYDPDYYEKGPRQDPQGPASGRFRAVRGSCWDSEPRYVRAAGRNYRRPDSRGYGFGFRVAITVANP